MYVGLRKHKALQTVTSNRVTHMEIEMKINWNFNSNKNYNRINSLFLFFTVIVMYVQQPVVNQDHQVPQHSCGETLASNSDFAVNVPVGCSDGGYDPHN